MKNRDIRFRRSHFKNGKFIKFSYWGFFDGVFVGPTTISGRTNGPDEQYTGLKDRNEREVYEGDIISFRFISKNDVDYLHGEVVMDEYMWCVDAVDGEMCSINRIATPGIIGNIHENPELIKTMIA